MSENDPPPPRDDGAPDFGSSGLELNLPPPPPGPQTAPAAAAAKRSTSNPGMAAVRSASRAQPLPSGPPVKKLTKAKLQEGFVDTLLNSVSILSEMMDDFRSSDRFFKYKAGVLGAWLFLSISSFAVACPGQGPSNDIDATLVVTPAKVYMIKNSSTETWVQVKVIVNSQYISTLNEVRPSGDITLSPAVLYDTNGTHAPSDLVIRDIVVDVDEPSAQVHLLRDGQARTK